MYVCSVGVSLADGMFNVKLNYVYTNEDVSYVSVTVCHIV